MSTTTKVLQPHCTIKSVWRGLAGLCAALIALPSFAQFVNLEPDLLPVEEAFALSARYNGTALEFTVAVADGYYLYKDRLYMRSVAGPQVGTPKLPEGKVITDEFFGEIATYRGTVNFSAPVSAQQPRGDLLVELITQGCADAGVCYPPYTVQLAFADSGGDGQLIATDISPGGVESNVSLEDNTQGLQTVLLGASLWLIALAFFNAGLLLSFTPCVLPMIPIAMAITTKGTKVGSGRSMALGGVYVVGMALVYTALGVVVAGSGGVFLTGLLQNIVLQVVLACLFMMLGVLSWRESGFNLLPATINNWLHRQRGKPGTLSGAAMAGAIAALVISPCVATPLVGALLFIASTGDTSTGAVALFSLAIGMGVLPFACSAGAANLLPRSGPLGTSIRKVFALLLVALGLWILGPAIPIGLKLIGYGLLGLAGAWVLFLTIRRTRGISRALASGGAVGFTALGTVMLVGGLTGGDNELAPLAHLSSQSDLEFVSVVNVDQYETATAQYPGRASLEYYYADWCVSCKEIEAAVFNDDTVIAAIDGMTLLKVDLSANDVGARTLISRNELFGPPAVIVRDATGRQIARLVGNFDKQLLLDVLARVG